MYESAAQTTRTSRWRAPTASPNDILGSLATIRDRSRAAARNNGIAKGVLDKLVTNIVGTGIVPLPQVGDASLRSIIQARWTRWTDESDAAGLLDWYGQQAQLTRSWLEAGDVFARLRPRLPSDGLSVPIQVELLETELCSHLYSVVLSNGNRVRAGIEFDKIGRRVAYWFFASRPGDLRDFDPAELRRVPADVVSHVYDPLRPGQLRGLPYLTQALVKLYEVDKFDDATLLRQQLANMFVAFLTHQTEGDEATDLDPMTGQARATDANDKPTLALEPGIFQELSPGEDVTFSEPPGAGEGYADFMRQQLAAVAAATNVPYEVLTGDMRGISDRTLRVILIEFRRRIQAFQHHIIAFQFCRRVWRAWFDRAVLVGALPIDAREYVKDPERFRAVKWMPQGWPYLHPVQDVEASKQAIRAGLTSRSAEVSEQGEDAAQIDAEQAADNARADDLGLVYDSDARYVSQAGLTQARPPGSVPPAPGEFADGGDTGNEGGGDA